MGVRPFSNRADYNTGPQLRQPETSTNERILELWTDVEKRIWESGLRQVRRIKLAITDTHAPRVGTTSGSEQAACVLPALAEHLHCVATLLDASGQPLGRAYPLDPECRCDCGHLHSAMLALGPREETVHDCCRAGPMRLIHPIEVEGSDRHVLLLCREGCPPLEEPSVKIAVHCLGILLGQACRQRDLLTSLRVTFLGTLTSLVCTVDGRAARTRGHSVRVARFAVAIGHELGLPAEELSELELAALLHDVGSLAVPESILHKPAPLSEEEWEQVKQQPLHTARLLEPLGHVGELVTWIRHCHERPDGSGYPDGLSDDRIPLGSRILAVADAFDAMTNDRPHRRAMSDEEALCALNDGAGKQFDRRVVEAFFEAYSQGKVRGQLSQFECGMECD